MAQDRASARLSLLHAKHAGSLQDPAAFCTALLQKGVGRRILSSARQRAGGGELGSSRSQPSSLGCIPPGPISPKSIPAGVQRAPEPSRHVPACCCSALITAAGPPARLPCRAVRPQGSWCRRRGSTGAFVQVAHGLGGSREGRRHRVLQDLGFCSSPAALCKMLRGAGDSLWPRCCVFISRAVLLWFLLPAASVGGIVPGWGLQKASPEAER